MLELSLVSISLPSHLPAPTKLNPKYLPTGPPLHLINTKMSSARPYLTTTRPHETCSPAAVPDTLYISVEKGPSGIVLGDGTLLADTALGQAVEIVTDNDDSLNVYVFYQGKLNDGDGSRSRFFMCQANPLAVEW